MLARYLFVTSDDGSVREGHDVNNDLPAYTAVMFSDYAMLAYVTSPCYLPDHLV